MVGDALYGADSYVAAVQTGKICGDLGDSIFFPADNLKRFDNFFRVGHQFHSMLGAFEQLQAQIFFKSFDCLADC